MEGISDCGGQCAWGGNRMTEELFIRNVTEQIRCVKARDGIAKELSDHIEDQAAVYEEAGESHEEAVIRAVREMGDPVEVGVELDRIHRPQVDFKMIGMAFIFSIAGFFIIYKVDNLSQYPEYIMRQCVVLLLSFGVMAGMYFLDYSFIGRYAYGICVFATIAIYISTMFAQPHGVISINFTLVYLYVPIYAGILYRLRRRGYSAVAWGIGIQIVIAGLAYMLSGTLYTAVNVYMMCTVLLIMAIWKSWFAVDKKTAVAIVIGALVLAPMGLLIIRSVLYGREYGFQIQRLLAWLNPERYAEGAGYIYQWIRQELGMAKWIGASGSNTFARDELLGMGQPMPYPTEPFVLFQLVCTYGILTGLALILAFTAVIVRSFQIVRRQKNQLGFMISAACFMVFLFNCLEGVLINTGYYPVSSMQFPFVSYGACTGITYAVLIGLLLSIYRNERIITDEVSKRPTWRLSIKWEKR